MFVTSSARRLFTPGVFGLVLTAVALGGVGCGARDGGLFGPGPGGGGGEGGGTGDGGDMGGSPPLPPAEADKVDLLLVIDNSRSMADKQEILTLTIPELLRRFINPLCVDPQGIAVDGQPSDADDDCPAGSDRLFAPITDIHIGVISTSLGGHGSDACTGVNDPSENDRGRLLDRGPGNNTVPTYDGKQFLAWDPLGNEDPEGTDDPLLLESNLNALILGAGQLGCGFEATLESWYRFLVDPEPYASIQVVDNSAQLIGVDQVILEQRRNFLRPDSLLSIVMLSDENDCSIRSGGQFYFAAQVFQPGTSQPYHLPPPRAACEEDPYDPCCRSCGQSPGQGCSTAQDKCSEPLGSLDDHINLRCYEQKRRFGLDFLWPIDRYTAGLTDAEVTDRLGNVVPNPIFDDLDPSDALTEVRDRRLVYLTALIGVPWQDLARQDATGDPDLVFGLDAGGTPIGAFQNGEELASNATWDLVLGDPMTYQTSSSSLPTDPLMRESVEPRSGKHPITKEAVAPPGAGTNANSINGHEYSIPQRNDLQYACVFPLLEPRDCTNPGEVACDCESPNNDNPLCQNDFNQFGTTQYRAKAYPGLRHLELIRELGDRGVVGSICPAQLAQPTAADYGYVPAVRTLVREVAPILGD